MRYGGWWWWYVERERQKRERESKWYFISHTYLLLTTIFSRSLTYNRTKFIIHTYIQLLLALHIVSEWVSVCIIIIYIYIYINTLTHTHTHTLSLDTRTQHIYIHTDRCALLFSSGQYMFHSWIRACTHALWLIWCLLLDGVSVVVVVVVVSSPHKHTCMHTYYYCLFINYKYTRLYGYSSSFLLSSPPPHRNIHAHVLLHTHACMVTYFFLLFPLLPFLSFFLSNNSSNTRPTSSQHNKQRTTHKMAGWLAGTHVHTCPPPPPPHTRIHTYTAQTIT